MPADYLAVSSHVTRCVFFFYLEFVVYMKLFGRNLGFSGVRGTKEAS